MPKKVGAAAIPLAGKLDDRTAPYTVPMKAVPHQCGSLRTRPSSTFGSPRCTWILQAGCSCARGAAPRWCFAAIATVAIATAAGRAGGWHARLRGARAQAATSALGAAGVLMRSGRGAGASVVVLAQTVAVTAVAANIT